MKRNVAYGLIAVTLVIVLLAMTARAPGGGLGNPLLTNHFAVEIEGVTLANFRSVSGLTCTTEVIEYRDGNDLTVRYLPGETRCGPVVLKAGLTTNRELWEWYQTIMNGEADKKNAAVILLDATNTERMRFNLYNAFPMKWEGPELDSSSTGVAVETLTLAVERIDRVSP